VALIPRSHRPRKAYRVSEHVEVTTADYLTDDLLAVPAYVDVGFIVAAAAAAGAHTFQLATSRDSNQSLYPIIMGGGFQFDFRQHSTRGPSVPFRVTATTQPAKPWVILVNQLRWTNYAVQSITHAAT